MDSGSRKARLRAIETLTYDTNEYRFEMIEPQSLAFRAGQFISVGCGVADSGKSERRAYSIASSPHESSGFSLVVKIIPGGLASGLFEHMRVGAEIDFTGPMGFFVLELAHPGDIVFGVTGTGIAPVLPMLEELAERPGERDRRIRLYWGLRRSEDICYLGRLSALSERIPGLETALCITQATPDFTGTRGRITQPVLDTLKTLRMPTFYLVGNGEMVRELSKLLQERGVDRKRAIRTEIFFTKPHE